MRTSLVIGLMILVGAFVSCERDKAVTPVSLSQLEGKWRLINPSFSGETTLTLSRQPTIATSLTAASIFQGSGKSIVNSYSTTLIIPDLMSQQVLVDAVGGTKVGGSVDVMQFEQAYFANLQAANRYELTNTNLLRLYHEGVQPGSLVYEKLN